MKTEYWPCKKCKGKTYMVISQTPEGKLLIKCLKCSWQRAMSRSLSKLALKGTI